VAACFSTRATVGAKPGAVDAEARFALRALQAVAGERLSIIDAVHISVQGARLNLSCSPCPPGLAGCGRFSLAARLINRPARAAAARLLDALQAQQCASCSCGESGSVRGNGQAGVDRGCSKAEVECDSSASHQVHCCRRGGGWVANEALALAELRRAFQV
jgi:hypothetical protein